MKDELELAQHAHAASSKSSVNAVLARVSAVGNSLVSLLSGLLAAVLILYSGIVLYDTFYIESSAANTPYEMLRYKPAELIDDNLVPTSGGSTLASINRDYRAWLTMYDTNIDYAVMQGPDDLYYATRDIYGQVSTTGAIYLAAANSGDCSDSYNLIYGHHMDNQAMFGGLDAFRDEAYFNSHREGTLVSASGVYDLRTFAVIDTDAYVGEVYSPGNTMSSTVSFLRARSAAFDGKTTVWHFDESALTDADRIVALSTCADAETFGRLVVFATMTRHNLLTLDAEGYEGVFDNTTHGPARIEVNYPDGTAFSYSTDNGVTWTPGLPEIREVGRVDAIIRAENPMYGTATRRITLAITPRPLTIRVRDSFKVFGQADPAWETDPITGILDGFVPQYTIARTNAGTEAAGQYPGVLIATGERRQGNYEITFIPGDFTITAANVLALIADGYDGVYDGNPHAPGRVAVNIAAGTTIEYSVDGGATWNANAPTILHVGTLNVLIRASNPGYAPVTAAVTLRVTPAVMTVTAQNAAKQAGEDDPVFTAVVTGAVDGFRPAYTISRPGAGTDENAGVYNGAIVPTGEANQGDYNIVFVPGSFTITAAAETIDEPEPPLAQFVNQFTPKPGRGTPAWALVNLICLLVTIYLLLPILHLKDKFGRLRNMKKYNSGKCALREEEDLDEEKRRERERILDNALEELRKNGVYAEAEAVSKQDFAAAVERLYYHVRKFALRFRLGLGLEVLDVIAAIVAFVLTEDMRLPMVLIDKWTPLMVLLLAICWILDVSLLRYRDKLEAEKETKETQSV